jgi:hypothetical protein
MGSLLDAELRRPDRSQWEPATVGAIDKLRGQSSATLLAPAGEGWEYGEEIPIQVTLNELEWAALPGGAGSLCWSGIEVRIERKELPDAGNRQYYLTAALLPPSFLWYLQAPLVPGLDPKIPGWRDSLRDLASGRIHISDLPFDPFEPDSGYLTARLGDPLRPHWQKDGNENVGDGFLVLRNRNRKSARQRMWEFGLCPAPPDEVVDMLVARMQPYLDDVLDGSADFYFPPRKPNQAELGASPGRVATQRPGQDEEQLLGLAQPDESLPTRVDWREKPLMNPVAQWRPRETMLQVSLRAAVLQSLARHEGSRRTLEQRIRMGFMNHFRDLDQRIRARDIPRRKVRALLEADYRDFIRDHPERDRLRPKGRLDTNLLARNASVPDPETKRCRDLFRRFHFEARARRVPDDAKE